MFISKIKETRNYLTHYSDEPKVKSLELRQLPVASSKLKSLLTILLLKELGIAEEKILWLINISPSGLLGEIKYSKKELGF